MGNTPSLSTPIIKSIASISNLAVFKNFNWGSEVRDVNNRPVYFKQLNIIYGRNYSGKTTLSRIIRSLETGTISNKYSSPAFTVQFTSANISWDWLLTGSIPHGKAFCSDTKRL